MPKKIEIDLAKLKQLHAQGLCDREIAQELGGVKASTIRLRRNGLGLPTVGRRGRRPGVTGVTRSQIASTGGNLQRRRKGHTSPAADVGRVTLLVDEVFLDGIWAALDLAEKAALVNRLCEG